MSHRIAQRPCNLSNPDLEWIGGALCLDYANTVDERGSESAFDRLASVEELIDWCLRAGCLDAEAGADLGTLAREDHRAASRFATLACSYREAIYSVFSAVAAGQPPDAADLDAVNRTSFALVAGTRLAPATPCFTRAWAGGRRLERLLWPIAWSVVDLLSGMELNRLRECATPECHWLFIDHSRNRSRRWCDMRSCGNVMKARRYYRRHRRETTRD